MAPIMSTRAIEDAFQDARKDLVDKFGEDRLAEKAFPSYANYLKPARYLAWSRVRHAQAMLDGASGQAALDFGSGLGVMLPFLAERYDRVVACDEDTEVTEYMVRRLGLTGVEVVGSVDDVRGPFDTVVALDVLEHIDDLAPIYTPMLAASAPDATWVISGPTENRLYGLMRKIARTTGDTAHVHTIHEVLDDVPAAMKTVERRRLPFGLPLFVVAEFRRTAIAAQKR